MPSLDTRAFLSIFTMARLFFVTLLFAVVLAQPGAVLAQSATVVANPSSFSTAGQTITFTYTINPGSFNMLTINNPTSAIKGVAITCPALPGGGTSSAFNCTGTYTVDALDDMSGTFSDFAVFTGTRTGGTFNITSPTLAVPKSGGGPVSMSVSASPSPTTPGNTVTVTASISSLGCNAGLMPPGNLVVNIGSDSRTLPLVAEFPFSTGGTVSFTSASLAAGTYALGASYAGGGGCAAGTATGSLVVEARPTVAVASLGQTGNTLGFSITFSAPVTGFTVGDVTTTASAGTPTFALTGSGANYTLTASNLASPSTIGVSVAANRAATAAGSQNLASGSPVTANFSLVPTVTSVSPNSGSTAGGTSVTLTGTNFTGATGVTFDGAAATSVNVVSPTSITATTPAGTGGTASVIVTTPGGSNAANTLFSYRDAQTITFTDPSDRLFVANESISLSATASSGLSVSFSSATPAVCSVSGSAATVLSAGTCTINANQAGDAAFLAAPQAQQSVVISPAAQVISFTDPSDIANFVPNQTFPLVATATSGLPVTFSSDTPAICSVLGTTATVLGAGSCKIDANQAGNSNFQAAPPVSQFVQIGLGNQTIDFTDPGDQTYVANGTVALTATATSGLTVSFTALSPACSVAGSTVTILAAGTCSILAQQSGNSNYNAAPDVQLSFAIAPATQTITFTDPADRAYAPNASVALTATASSGLTVSLASTTPGVCSVSGATATVLAAGTCTINATQAGNANVSPAPQVSQSFTISLADQVLTFTSSPPNPSVFGGSYDVSATGGGSANPVVFSSSSTGVCEVSGSTVSFVGAGSCTVDANQAADANHNAGTASQTFTIGKQSQTIAFAPLTITQGYVGGPTYTVAATGGGSGEPVVFTVAAASAANCSISGSVVTFLAAGSCQINADQAGTANYDPAAQASQSITVSANTQPVANAGPDQSDISEGTVVTLDGSGSSDPDAGQVIGYSWQQISGPAVTLSSTSDAQPTFTSPALTNGNPTETLVFELTVSDDAGGSDTDQVSIGIVDVTDPTVALSGLPSEARTGDAFTVTFTFSETVTGFDVADITATHASLSGFGGSGTTYFVTVTPDGGGDVGLSVGAGAANDQAGNPNVASGATVTLTATTETEELLRKEALARNRALIASQPDLLSFLMNSGSGGLSFSTKGEGITFDVATDPDKQLWLRLNGRWGAGDLAADRYVHGVLGAHIYRTETFIFGAMLQGDRSELADGLGTITSTGWLAGPYVVARPNSGNLIFAASYLAGRSDLSISPLSTFVDEVTSDRQLATVSIAHEIAFGNTTLWPRLDISRVAEDRPGYIDGLGNPVAAGNLDLTEASIGLDFRTLFPVADGTSQLSGGISGILSHSNLDGDTEVLNRGKVSVAWLREYDRGLSLNFEANYDGIGASEVGSFGVGLSMGLTF